MKLTDRQVIILKALAHFKFLTSKQLKQIFHGLSLSAINHNIRQLKTFRYPLMKSLDFGVVPGKGRLSRIHFLSTAWKRVLINKCQLVPGNIQLPKASSSFFQRDYFHRLATIDFSIMFQQWLAANNYKLKSLFLYFNKQYLGEKIIADTKVIIQGKTIEPDLVGIYQAKWQFHCFFFEQHNGKNAKRALQQIEKYCLGLTYGIKSKKWLSLKLSSIVFVFEYEQCLKSVLKLFMKKPLLRQYKNSFLFKHQKALHNNFSHNRIKPDGQQVNFYPENPFFK